MYYIGLMSGTSADGVDAALVEIDSSTHQDSVKLVGYTSVNFSASLQKEIIALYTQGDNEIDRLGVLTHIISEYYARAVNTLLEHHSILPSSINALGCHGQTVRHRPDTRICPHPFTLQLLDPSMVAQLTGITVACDFRRKDMALGGQGAPLVPAFHHAIFAHPAQARCIVNIGGIANLTFLDNGNVSGFDTGPGNALIDAWMQAAFDQAFDHNGEHANQGQVQINLLDTLNQHIFFKQQPPKSTGREEFTLEWLTPYLSGNDYSNNDIIATLTELTASTITHAIQDQKDTCDVFICGGGARNSYLLSRIEVLLGDNYRVKNTLTLGVDPQHVEAMAFAWLAKQTFNHLTGNEPSATGASRKAILGGIYPP